MREANPVTINVLLSFGGNVLPENIHGVKASNRDQRSSLKPIPIAEKNSHALSITALSECGRGMHISEFQAVQIVSFVHISPGKNRFRYRSLTILVDGQFVFSQENDFPDGCRLSVIFSPLFGNDPGRSSNGSCDFSSHQRLQHESVVTDPDVFRCSIIRLIG